MKFNELNFKLRGPYYISCRSSKYKRLNNNHPENATWKQKEDSHCIIVT